MPRQHKEPEKTYVPLAPIQIVRVMPVQPVIVRDFISPAETYAPLQVPKSEPKELTPVKEQEPEKINKEINKSPSNDNFSVNFSGPGPIKKLPKKMQFKGKVGRQRTEAEVEELLTLVQARNGVWPNDNYVSQQMQRYYRREYPEYFRKGKKGKKVQAHRSTPIDLQSRRSGTNA